MTLAGLMDAIKEVYMRVATGPLRDPAWRVLNGKASRDLQSYLRHNPQRLRMRYAFHLVIDTDGRNEFNNRGIEGARGSWIRALERGGDVPDKSLEVSGTVTCRDGGRAVIEITARARDLSSLTVGRGSSTDRPRGERVREEGSRARVREGSDLSRLATLSGGAAGTARTATGQGPAEEE